jgi:cbb3-type cytochrome oxidase cytochrome c subunit
VPKKVDEYLRNMGPLNTMFAASSIALLVITVWMVYDDHARGWKSYQKEFQGQEAARTRGEIESFNADLDQQTLARLEARLEEARAAMDQQAESLEEARARLRDIETTHYKTDLDFRTVKSTYDAKKFEYEEAVHQEASTIAARESEMRDLEGRLEELRIRLQENDKARDEADRRIKEITGRGDAVQKEIDAMTADRDRLLQKLDKVAPRGVMRLATDLLNAPLMDFVAPTLKIRQVVLESIPIDINFTQIPRVDRCQTCHLGVDLAGYESAEQPFRTHPRLDLFVGGSSPHPVERFGCTPCHGGRDRAVDFVYATHTPDDEEQREAWEHAYGWERDHYWEHPMLALGRSEAGCLKCHQGVVSVPEAPRLNRGLALIERHGCYGCHKMKGFNDRPKVGPPLMRITSKTSPDWMARWIKNPKAFRPSSRMPRFFGLSNNQGPGDAEREDAEILGMVAYLESRSAPFPTPGLPGRGDRRRGELLVKTIGCMGCHAIERDEIPAEALQARDGGEGADPVAFERRFGPDLSRVGSKNRPEWIFRWVQEPHAYNPLTRMPSLRLTRQEALDVTSYLISLRDDSPAGARVAPLEPRPEARQRTLMGYLSQRMPPADAEAKLASMSDREQDIMLGERSIARYGCFGCHLIPGFETTPPIGVDLSQEGSKHSDLLYFGYQKIEHTSHAWFFQKLREPRSFDEGKVAEFYDRLRMPQFDFTEEQAAAITLVLQGMTKEKVPLESVRRPTSRDDAIESGRRIIRDHNCQGCHIYEGAGGAIRASLARHYVAEGRSQAEAESLAASFAPPILDGEGDKAQADWLFSFLKGPAPIRPWLQVRMPTFSLGDEDASALVSHFAAKVNRTYPFQTFDRPPLRGSDLRAALKLFSPDYFNCWSCHQQGERKPQGPPEGWAPDLMLAYRRLNPDWIERWIEDPQKLLPGTKMPTFYIPGDLEASAPPDVLGGDPHRQILILADYIFNLGGNGATAGGGR